MSTGKSSAKKKATTGGRRRNYAPAPDQIGWRAKIPTGWANWLGFALFGFCCVAVLVGALVYVGNGDYADATVAGLLGVALAYMVYLFGTTRLRV